MMNDTRSETEIRCERRKDQDIQSEKDHRKALLLLMGDKLMKIQVKNKSKYGCVSCIYNEFKQRYKWLTKKKICCRKVCPKTGHQGIHPTLD